MNTIINTLNESNLHKQLKKLYSIQNFDSTTEKQIGPYIVDIETKTGDIIEIQTGNIATLTKKIEYFSNAGRHITIIYPLPAEKIIRTIDSEGKILSTRKSPKRKSIYNCFREFTKYTELIDSPNLTIEILYTTIMEERTKSDTPIFYKSHHPKNYTKTNKFLESINSQITLNSKKDWNNLFPKNLPEFFTVKDLTEILKKSKINVSQREIRLIIWFYTKTDYIKYYGKLGKSFLYTISQP